MTSLQLKSILKILLSIFILSFVGDKVVFFALNTLNDKVLTGQVVGKLNQYIKVKDSVNLLVLGSSRANHTIDNIQLDSNSFNMGMDGCSIAYITTLIKLLSNKPQTLLIQIDAPCTYDPTYQGEDIQALNLLYNKNDIVKEEFKKLKLSNPFQDVYWSISYNSKLLGLISNYLKPKYDYKTYYGFDSLAVTNDQKRIFTERLKTEHEKPCLNSFQLNSITNNFLAEIKKISVEKNKNTIFYTAPIYNDSCKTDNEFLSQVMQSNNFTYYDYSDSLKENNSIDFWKDATHLSNIGASAFTMSLKKKIFTK